MLSKMGISYGTVHRLRVPNAVAFHTLPFAPAPFAASTFVPVDPALRPYRPLARRRLGCTGFRTRPRTLAHHLNSSLRTRYCHRLPCSPRHSYRSQTLYNLRFRIPEPFEPDYSEDKYRRSGRFVEQL